MDKIEFSCTADDIKFCRRGDDLIIEDFGDLLIDPGINLEDRDPIETEEERLAQKDPRRYAMCIGDMWFNKQSFNCWMLFSRHYNVYHWVPQQEWDVVKDLKGLEKHGYCRCKLNTSDAGRREDQQEGGYDHQYTQPETET